jgi:arabinogalactan oligomer/maltooligosaccharide transport system permease protein
MTELAPITGGPPSGHVLSEAAIEARNRYLAGDTNAKLGPGRWFGAVGWRYIVGIAAVLFALFPAVYAVSSSFNGTGSLTGSGLLPTKPTLANYRKLFDGSVPYRSWLTNSLAVSGAAAICQTFLSALAAYAFSRMRFLGRRAGMLTVLLVQMFPQALAFTAIFVMVTDLNDAVPFIALGSRFTLFLIYLGGALGVNTWLMKGYFDTIPRSLDESALIDGASHVQIFVKIILPLAAPVLAVVTLLSFVFLFNEFLVSLVVLGQGDSTKFTLPVGLFRFVDGRGSRWGAFTAGAVLASVPVVLLFQFLQRYIVSGLTAGATKG